MKCEPHKVGLSVPTLIKDGDVRFSNMTIPAYVKDEGVRLSNVPTRERISNSERDFLRHISLNAGVPSGRICIREGIEVAVDNISTFEVHCFASIEVKEEMDFFIERMKGKKRLLDIGALHGIFSLVFTSQPGTEAIAVEPSPPALKSLHKNVQLNPDRSITIIERAISSSEGYIRMVPEWQYLVAREPPAGVPSFQVKSITADSIGCYPDMVKIDVEGHEMDVIEGMDRILNDGPDIFVEMHGPFLKRSGSSVGDVFDTLSDYGYELHNMFGEWLAYDEKLEDQFFHVFASKDPL